MGEIQKLGNVSIRAVSWHLWGFQKLTGPPLSGRLGIPGGPGNFLTWCEALFLHFASPGATSGQNATCNTTQQIHQISAVSYRRQVVAGLSEARGNSFNISGTFLRQSWVGNREFDVRTKFEKAKISSTIEVAQNCLG